MLIITANYRQYDRTYEMPGAIVYNEARRENVQVTGRYLSKGPKCAPHLLGHKEKDILWIDGSMRWTGRPLDELFALVPDGGVGIYRHRFRDCIFQETLASIVLDRYRGEPIEQQAAHYRNEGHPEHWGLWETGILVWRGAQYTIGTRWLAELLVWSTQCQVSLPHVLRELGVMPTTLQPGNVVSNPWFRYEEHVRGAEI